jgi:hypothetical protein
MQHLFEPQLVAVDRQRDKRRRQLDHTPIERWPDLVDHPPCEVPQVQRRALDAELPGLQARNIEQRQHHAVQARGLVVDHPQVAQLALGQRALAQRAALHQLRITEQRGWWRLQLVPRSRGTGRVLLPPPRLGAGCCAAAYRRQPIAMAAAGQLRQRQSPG